MAEKLTSETIFSAPNQVAPLSIIAQPGTEELAAKINYYLSDWSAKAGVPQDSFLIPAECPRFSSPLSPWSWRVLTTRGEWCFIILVHSSPRFSRRFCLTLLFS